MSTRHEEHPAVVDCPFRPVRFPAVELVVERCTDGSHLLAARQGLQDYEPNLLKAFARHAAKNPQRTWLARRDPNGGDWVRQSFAAAKRDMDAVAQWLLNQGMTSAGPMLILSGNSIAHASMLFGGMIAGVPVCAVSENYSRMGKDFSRLHHVVNLIRPAVVFVERTSDFEAALQAIQEPGLRVIAVSPDIPSVDAVVFEEVLSTPVGAALTDRVENANPDAPARYMLTSGSTGKPKAVIHTQRMITANIAQTHQFMGDAFSWNDLVVDWAPWHHASGATVLMATAYLGGSLYIDEGRPVPGRFEPTVGILREIPVRYYGTVPAGFAMLAEALEADDELRRRFFSELRVMLFGGAGLPQQLHDRIQAIAVAETGQRIMFVSGYGSTETTSGCLMTYFHTYEVGIGLPLPGVTVKLVPVEQEWEIRIRGPNVTPGYLDDPKNNRDAFDADGYYRMGDLCRYHDPAQPTRGLAFAGRMAEQFKLDTATFVAGGAIRQAMLERLGSVVSDLVIAGDNRAYIGVLAWPNAAGIRSFLDASPETPLKDLLDSGTLRDFVVMQLAEHNAENPGRSTRVERLVFLAESPDAESHELSDKGSINRNVVLARRVSDVERLYAEPCGGSVISVS